MNDWISVLNNVSVSIFGSVLSAAFCNALNSKRKRWVFILCMIGLLLLQGGSYLVWPEEVLRRIYPLIMHAPLLMVLYFLTGKWFWPYVSILSAYLCCQTRRWFGLLAIEVFREGAMVQDLTEFILTFPLLVLFVWFVAPFIYRLSDAPLKIQFQFSTIPALYYAFDYLTRVYTEFLYSGSPVAVEFMPFVCCILYLVFLVHNSSEERKRNELQLRQKSLDIQLVQAVKEINALRESQELARQYRHDLRHHLQYISNCIENGQEESAKNYILGIYKEIETQTVKHYCENEAANLILSAFAGRAEKAGICINVIGNLPEFMTVSDSDLCVVLSNALENALHACGEITLTGRICTIEVQFYVKDNKFFLQMKNPCGENVRFVNDIPVSEKEGHGIGVQSICAIVEKYHGVYSFSVQEGMFILRLSV